MPGQQIPRLLGVVGAGQMGAGIAQVAASKGVPVVLVDVAQRSLDQGLATIQRSLAKQIQKQHSTQEEADKTSAYIRTSLSLKVAVKLHLQPVGTHHQLLPSQELEQADFIIEAVSESERLKKSIFEQLGKVSVPDFPLECWTDIDVGCRPGNIVSLTPSYPQTSRPDAILASNTSSISITRIAAATARPQQVVRHSPPCNLSIPYPSKLASLVGT